MSDAGIIATAGAVAAIVATVFGFGAQAISGLLKHGEAQAGSDESLREAMERRLAVQDAKIDKLTTDSETWQGKYYAAVVQLSARDADIFALHARVSAQDAEIAALRARVAAQEEQLVMLKGKTAT